MIKLVSQFDNEKSRISLATPTCCGGCCCCSCCCLVSTIATASISARNFGKLVKEKQPEDNKKIKSAKKIGFVYPITLLFAVILWIILTLSSSIQNIFNNYIINLIIMIGMPIFIVSILWTNFFNKKYETSSNTFWKILSIGVFWCLTAIIEFIICFFLIINFMK
ncbi:MAG: hypothetical protein IKF17_03935 [Clostridia bacterium]|nr:hypothetical protein [Clostridia bacterium]